MALGGRDFAFSLVSWSLTAATVAGIADLLSRGVLGAALLIPAMLVLAVVAGLVIGLVGRLVAKLDDDALARWVASTAPAVGSLAAVAILPTLGGQLWIMLVGGALGTALAVFTRPSLAPTPARVRSARDIFRGAARFIDNRTSEDEPDAMIASLKKMIVDCEMEVGTKDTTTARLLSLVADFLVSEQQWKGAQALYQRALNIFLGSKDCAKETALVYHNLGVLYLRMGQPDRGIASCEKALSYSNQPLDVARMEDVRARLWAEQGDFQKAAESGEKSLQTLRDKLGDSHQKTLEVTALLAEYYGKGGDGVRARELLDEVLALREKAGVPEDETSLEMRARLAAMEGNVEAFLPLLEPLRIYGGARHPWAKTIVQWCLPHLLAPDWDEATLAFWTALAQNDQTAARSALHAAPEAKLQVDRSGWSVLHWCAFWGYEQIFESMVFHERGPVDMGHAPASLVAARWGQRKMLMALLKRGVEPTAVDAQARNVGHLAAMAGDAKTLAALPEEGVGLEEVDSSGQTPLHLACLYGRSEAVLELIALGVDLGQPTEDGRSPLHLAVESGSPHTAQALLNNGAKLKDKRALLERARQLGHDGMIEILEAMAC